MIIKFKHWIDVANEKDTHIKKVYTDNNRDFGEIICKDDHVLLLLGKGGHEGVGAVARRTLVAIMRAVCCACSGLHTQPANYEKQNHNKRRGSENN